MTDRTWVGGSANNNASSSNNWNPKGAPKHGDNLTMNRGTIAISHSNLAGDTLAINMASPQPVIDLHDSAVKVTSTQPVPIGGGFTVNASGNDTLTIVPPEPVYFSPTINLAANTHLLLNGGNLPNNQLKFFAIDINGGPHSEIINNGTIGYFGAGGHIDAGLVGHGIVKVTRAHDGNGTLEVNGKVGSGQTFDITSDAFSATLAIGQPHSFKGTINIEPDLAFNQAMVTLNGLHATSFDIKHDILRLFAGDKVVDTLRVNNMTSEPMSVVQRGSSVIVDFGAPVPGTILHQHT